MSYRLYVMNPDRQIHDDVPALGDATARARVLIDAGHTEVEVWQGEERCVFSIWRNTPSGAVQTWKLERAFAGRESGHAGAVVVSCVLMGLAAVMMAWLALMPGAVVTQAQQIERTVMTDAQSYTHVFTTDSVSCREGAKTPATFVCTLFGPGDKAVAVAEATTAGIQWVEPIGADYSEPMRGS